MDLARSCQLRVAFNRARSMEHRQNGMSIRCKFDLHRSGRVSVRILIHALHNQIQTIGMHEHLFTYRHTIRTNRVDNSLTAHCCMQHRETAYTFRASLYIISRWYKTT